MESRIRHKDGFWIWVQDRGRVLTRDTGGRALRIAGTHLEITQRKQAEARLLMSLHEKENLLKEVYHRTKNNMMVIISLLNLQQQELDRRAIKDVLKQVANRIFSMSMVHQQLYQSKNIATIQLENYIRELVNHLRASLLKHPERVAINCQCESVQLGLQEAVTLGLVLNEILTNSFKHAFPDNRSGNVTLNVTQSESGLIQIDIKDDGVGLADIEQSSTQQTMGRKLIQMLVEDQLFGDLTVESDEGVHYHLAFTVESDDEEETEHLPLN
jgi:two-component sensor histidine kinase